MQQLNNYIYTILFALVFLGLTGCGVTKYLSEDEYLLNRNVISVISPDSLSSDQKLASDELEPFISLLQQPNKRFMGISFGIWAYNQADSSQDRWFDRTMRKVGDAPVIFDSSYMAKSHQEMLDYVRARGFYDAKVSDSVCYKRGQAYVNYKIESGTPYIISNVKYNYTDISLKPLIESDTLNSFVKVGRALSRIDLENERSRIADYLEDRGYYQFSVNSINYLVDTLVGNRQAGVQININRAVENNSYVDNRIYRIRNVYVDSNYQPYIADSSRIAMQVDTIEYNGINYIYSGGDINIRPEVLARTLSIFPGSIYDRSEIDYTSARISNLKYFKSVNILFSEVFDAPATEVTYIGASDTTQTTQEGVIDCKILCTPIQNQSYSVDTEFSTNNNYTGLSLTLGYANRNIFNGAEVFDISAKTAYQFVHAQSRNDSYEFGGRMSLTFVRLLTPFGIARYSRAQNTSTKIEVSVNTQRRPDYDRTISSLNFGYSWSGSNKLSFTFNPVALSMIKVPRIDSVYLESITNPYLRNSYSSQMILGVSGGIKYSTLGSNDANRFAVRFNGESSGNALNAVSKLVGRDRVSKDGEEYYETFGIRYAQYLRGELSLIYYRELTRNTLIATRLYVGGGYAYGNTKSLPFERMFYSGGAYSMRGWQVRALGPGATPAISSTTYPNQVGDVRVEANIEGRFPVAGFLDGALFLDVGNVWSNGVGEQNEYAKFKFSNFLSQLGVNTGVGARFDFDFFVLRVDWGIQLRNPGWGVGKEWIESFKFDNSALHFGIGYPF